MVMLLPGFITFSLPSQLFPIRRERFRIYASARVPPTDSSTRLAFRNVEDLEQELRLFSLKKGLNPDELPRITDLLSGHRKDLLDAIWKHHDGLSEYQKKTSLVRSERHHIRRTSKYSSWETLSQEITSFVDKRARSLDPKNAQVIRKYMPRQADFAEEGRGDLLHAIRRAGGMIEVARRMKLLPNYHAVSNYKDDFSGLADAITEFAKGHACSDGMFPTGEAIRRCGRLDLLAGIRQHGGASKVAALMNLKLQKGALGVKEKRKQLGWLKKELASVRPDLMPTNSELINGGRLDLLRAVKNLGGRKKIAEALAISLEDKTFLSEDIFGQEVCESRSALDYNLGNELQRKPTDKKPIRGGGGGAVLGREGGRRREAYHFQDFERVKDELMCFIFDDGQMGVMPTRSELLRAGRGDLLRAMSIHGGQKIVARKLGLVRHAESREQSRKGTSGAKAL